MPSLYLLLVMALCPASGNDRSLTSTLIGVWKGLGWTNVALLGADPFRKAKIMAKASQNNIKCSSPHKPHVDFIENIVFLDDSQAIAFQHILNNDKVRPYSIMVLRENEAWYEGTLRNVSKPRGIFALQVKQNIFNLHRKVLLANEKNIVSMQVPLSTMSLFFPERYDLQGKRGIVRFHYVILIYRRYGNHHYQYVDAFLVH